MRATAYTTDTYIEIALSPSRQSKGPDCNKQYGIINHAGKASSQIGTYMQANDSFRSQPELCTLYEAETSIRFEKSFSSLSYLS